MRPIGKKWKCALDAILFVLLVLMYRKNALGLSFHEIGGLALIALFVVHHVFNGRWIVAVSKRLFCKDMPVKARVQYIAGVLMAVCFLLIGVSGVLMSKVVFRVGTGGAGWRTVHYFCAALALVFSGVHVGLHLEYLFYGLAKKRMFQHTAVRALSIVLCAALLGYGAYSIVSTSFGRWLALPFAQSDGLQGGVAQDREESDFRQGGGSRDDSGMGAEHGKGNGAKSDFRQGDGPRGGMAAGHGKGNGAAGGGALATLLQFSSVAAVFATLTYGAERLVTRKRRTAQSIEATGDKKA